MTERLKPETPEQVLEAVQWGLAEGHTYEVTGQGSKRGYGAPPAATHGLDLTGLSGIQLYEPGELVMSAGCATPLADIAAALNEHRQRLAFEPPNLGPLLAGGTMGGGSIGGLFACNLAGPRRIQAGAARDHLLGFHGVSGLGEQFKSGGRVVKNVTGFDLCKLMAGSFGTLAVLTDVTFKVLPMPEKTRTVLVLGLSDDDAVVALTRALHGAYDVSGAVHLPADIAAESGVSYVVDAGCSVTAIRIEGPGPSVDVRCRALRDDLAGFGDTEELHSSNSHSLWREVRDVDFFIGDDKQVWRLSVAPADGPAVARAIQGEIGGRVFYDWGGGLIWLAIKERPDADHQSVRAVVDAAGGHATLIRASEPVRAAVPVFHPQAPALAAITQRVKESFDPKGLFNPGRMG